jgi:hypothetical protein
VVKVEVRRDEIDGWWRCPRREALPTPPEEPPAVCAADHGSHVRPQSEFALSKVNINGGTFVLAQ